MLGLGLNVICFVFSQGAVQGPEEFAEGLVIGVRSLFGHTVGRKPGKYWTFASFSAFNVHKSVVNSILEWIKAVISKGPWPRRLMQPCC